MHRQLTILVLMTTLATVSLAGAPANTVEVGPRQVGMGGTFTGLADDVYANWYNPAGLPRLQRQEYTFSYVPQRMVSEISSMYGGATLPLGDLHAVGLDFYRESFTDNGVTLDDGSVVDKLTVDYFTARASYGLLLHRSLSLGVTGRYLAPLTTKYNDVELDNPTGFGIDFGGLVDFGTMYRPLNGLRFGFIVRDVSTSLKHSTDKSEDYPTTYTMGLSYSGVSDLIVATDWTKDDRVHLGAEYTLFNMVSLRAGLARDVGGYGSDMLYSAGLGFKYMGMSFDYAMQTHPAFNPTHLLALSFTYNPSYITIRDAKVNPAPLFRALYRHYETEPDFAEVTLKNTSQEPLKVSVGIKLPTMMKAGQMYSEDFTIAPQAIQKVSLGVTVDDSLLIRESSQYDNLVQPEVVVSYIQDTEAKKTSKKLPSVYVLGRNKMTWENPLRISTFITPEHQGVIRFGDWTVRNFRNRRDEVFAKCPNFGTAMLIFDAIGKYGISYNPDQTTPFYKIASDTANMRTIFDTIKYPVDILRSRLGDCDDCTVLYSSLLEQQNIPTALLDVFDPVWGHVYMMFDTGLTPDEAMATGLFLSKDEFVSWADSTTGETSPHAWIPVETTMYGQTFTSAWDAGMKEYTEKKSRNYIRHWSVSDGRQKYQAGIVDSFTVVLPTAAAVSELIELDIRQFRERLALPALATDASAHDWYERGVLLVQRSQYANAIGAFTRAINLDGFLNDAYNGRGVARNHEGGRVRYLTDDPARRREQAETMWKQAVADFRKAIEIKKGEPGYWVNLMISYQLLNAEGDARKARQEALEIDAGLKPILDELVPGME
jgi:hypothetical protein